MKCQVMITIKKRIRIFNVMIFPPTFICRNDLFITKHRKTSSLPSTSSTVCAKYDFTTMTDKKYFNHPHGSFLIFQ